MKDRPDGKHARMEKYILRKAFDLADQPYLPEEVLWRQKEQFSDGVGYSWVDGLRDFAAQVSDSPGQDGLCSASYNSQGWGSRPVKFGRGCPVAAEGAVQQRRGLLLGGRPARLCCPGALLL